MKPIYEEKTGPPEHMVDSGEYCESKDCEYRDEKKNCSHPNPVFKKGWSSHDIFPYLYCITYKKVDKNV